MTAANVNLEKENYLRPGTLSPRQLADFDRDGFLVLPDFVAPDACDALRARAIELAAQSDPSEFITAFASYGQRAADDTDKAVVMDTDMAAARYVRDSADKISFFFEPAAFDLEGNLTLPKELAILKIGHGLQDCDPLFDAFSRSPRFEVLAESLGLREPLLAEGMYFFKQPKVGCKIDIHQDATFLYTEPSSVVGLWTAVEDANVENGCLWGLPGGHKLGLKSRYVRTDTGDTFDVLDPAPYSEADFVPLEAKKGSVVLLHGMVPHMSKANLSSRSRHAYSVHLIDGTLPWPEGNWLQRPPSNPFRGFR